MKIQTGTLTLRIPNELLTKLSKLAKQARQHRSTLVREILEKAVKKNTLAVLTFVAVLLLCAAPAQAQYQPSTTPYPLGGLVLLFLYIQGIAKSRGKRILAFLYSLAALTIWFVIGVGVEMWVTSTTPTYHGDIAGIFGHTALVPLWFGTMFTRQAKKTDGYTMTSDERIKHMILEESLFGMALSAWRRWRVSRMPSEYSSFDMDAFNAARKQSKEEYKPFADVR